MTKYVEKIQKSTKETENCKKSVRKNVYSENTIILRKQNGDLADIIKNVSRNAPRFSIDSSNGTQPMRVGATLNYPFFSRFP